MQSLSLLLLITLVTYCLVSEKVPFPDAQTVPPTTFQLPEMNVSAAFMVAATLNVLPSVAEPIRAKALPVIFPLLMVIDERQPPGMNRVPEKRMEPSGFVTPCTKLPFIAELAPVEAVTVPDQLPVIVGGGGAGAGVEFPPQAESTQRQQTSKTHRAFIGKPF